MTEKVIQGKKIAIIGLARTGKALALLMKRLGTEVFVSENRRNPELEAIGPELESAGIEYELGDNSKRILKADFIAISPGVPLDIDVLVEARQIGIPIFSELEVSSWFCKSPIIAVTGSNGKTTTTTLIGKLLSDNGMSAYVGGNIGIPFASFVNKTTPDDYVVLEVSSFQLEAIEGFKPKIAIILNFTPDHLDRYPAMDEYRMAKARIYENMGEGDYLILNADDPQSAQFMPKPEVNVLRFSIEDDEQADAFVRAGRLMLKSAGRSHPVIPADEVGIPGPHNLANSAAASLAANLAGVSIKHIGNSLRDFSGVEHRLETVTEINGVKYVNDSKGTNVDAVQMALRSVNSPIILIAGGKDKGGDFSVLRNEIKKKVKGMVLIGEAADKIDMQLSDTTKTHRASSMKDAVEKTASLAQGGDTVLLSPGCASFDMFRDYEERGRIFKDEVNRLKERMQS